MTANTHIALVHAAQSVRNFGPTWVYASWSMEDFSGSLVAGPKSFNAMLPQVCSCV